jgi:hypothetical protein
MEAMPANFDISSRCPLPLFLFPRGFMAIHISHSGPRLQYPVHEELAGKAVYGLGAMFQVQVSPAMCAAIVNLRVIGAKAIDMEAGTDVVLFDSLEEIKAENARPLDRNEPGTHPVTGEELTMVKYPGIGGFVPRGARLADGTPHPHAGTGFGLAQALGYPVKKHVDQPFDSHDVAVFFELAQYRFDGERFYIERRERMTPEQVLPGYVVKNRPLSMGVMSGDGFVTGMVAGKPGEVHGVGVTRWSRASGWWRPEGFNWVTEKDTSFEPSTVRDSDGAILLCARGYGVEGISKEERAKIDPAKINRFQVWRSRDEGATWEQIIKLDNMRPWSPVCINLLSDGTPYIAANRKVQVRPDMRGATTPDARMREYLCAWKLAADRRNVEPESLLLDANQVLGTVPSGLVWYLDHPIGALLTFNDGQKHAVIGFRVADAAEVVRDARPSGVTGFWAQEVSIR